MSYPVQYIKTCLKSDKRTPTQSGSQAFGTARQRAGLIRIRRLSLGNPGDVKPVGEGISELRVNHGPGFRIYFIKKGDLCVVLLAGGDKSSQAVDITKAKALAREL